MAISVGGEAAETPMSDINTTPLVDVMLVLLIIFLITIPVVIQNVKLTLPDVIYDPTTTKPENVSLSVTLDPGGRCAVYWNLTRVTHKELYDMAYSKMVSDVKRLGGPANITADDLPEAHIRGDVNVPYQCIGGTIYTMQIAGYPKVGFISQPPARDVPDN
ncbi:MAG: biopolymer transporter ExbD [Pseudomonadota bacterium]|nr:biopolymer transporter ExbD [Pseudomonadota bacterium]